MYGKNSDHGKRPFCRSISGDPVSDPATGSKKDLAPKNSWPTWPTLPKPTKRNWSADKTSQQGVGSKLSGVSTFLYRKLVFGQVGQEFFGAKSFFDPTAGSETGSPEIDLQNGRFPWSEFFPYIFLHVGRTKTNVWKTTYLC